MKGPSIIVEEPEIASLDKVELEAPKVDGVDEKVPLENPEPVTQLTKESDENIVMAASEIKNWSSISSMKTQKSRNQKNWILYSAK